MNELNFVNLSAVKKYLHTSNRHMNSNVVPSLERRITELLDRAIKRATKNQRMTVMGRDI